LLEVRSNKALKAAARQRLQGNWAKSIGAMMIFILISSLTSIFFTLLKVGWIGDIFSFIITPPVIAGITVFFLKLIRGEAASAKLVLSQFPRFDAFLLMYVIRFIFTMLWTLLFIIPGIIASLRYSLAFYLMIDHPEMTGLVAIRRSKAMMHGYKWKLFRLQFSFIGWYLLCAVTFGIAAIWVMPYVFASQACFYDDLCNESK